MGVWARLTYLISANINSLLDGAENPERMLAQVIREMEEGLSLARGQAATAIAAARSLSRELDHHRAESNHWQERARLSWFAGREDLARQVLCRKLEHADLAAALEQQVAAAEQSSMEVKSALHALEARLAEARRRQCTLIARHRVARIRLEALRNAALVGPAAAVPLDRFAHFEKRLVELEDQLLAQLEVTSGLDEVSTEFADLQMNKRIEGELNALRQP